MKLKLIIPALLLTTLLGAQGIRKEAGNTFLEPLQKRDSVLIADQFRYGIILENVPEGTPLAFPEFKPEKDSPLEILGEWQLDSTRISKKKEVPARYNIKASILLTAFDGGIYELPDIPVLMDGDTLVFHGPEEPLEVKELPIDMETFQAHDIKPQVKFPYTFKEIFPWVLGVLVFIGLVYLLIRFIQSRRKAAQEKEKAEPAHIKALRKLDKYRSDKYWKPENQKTFYSGVTDALREYIVSRFGVAAMEMTTAEIFDGLKESDIPEDLYAQMKDLFERADFVKFAKFTATDEENATVLPRAVNFVTTTYQVQLEEEMKEE
ncbi:MAG: hypothetical protein E7125_01240 [Bacteroidales bacterium]|jgi:hypothetical protein|nr:hypothetical protein [Bacteroidales bacterium]